MTVSLLIIAKINNTALAIICTPSLLCFPKRKYQTAHFPLIRSYSPSIQVPLQGCNAAMLSGLKIPCLLTSTADRFPASHSLRHHTQSSFQPPIGNCHGNRLSFVNIYWTGTNWVLKETQLAKGFPSIMNRSRTTKCISLSWDLSVSLRLLLDLLCKINNSAAKRGNQSTVYDWRFETLATLTSINCPNAGVGSSTEQTTCIY